MPSCGSLLFRLTRSLCCQLPARGGRHPRRVFLRLHQLPGVAGGGLVSFRHRQRPHRPHNAACELNFASLAACVQSGCPADRCSSIQNKCAARQSIYSSTAEIGCGGSRKCTSASRDLNRLQPRVAFGRHPDVFTVCLRLVPRTSLGEPFILLSGLPAWLERVRAVVCSEVLP